MHKRKEKKKEKRSVFNASRIYLDSVIQWDRWHPGVVSYQLSPPVTHPGALVFSSLRHVGLRFNVTYPTEVNGETLLTITFNRRGRV